MELDLRYGPRMTNGGLLFFKEPRSNFHFNAGLTLYATTMCSSLGSRDILFVYS